MNPVCDLLEPLVSKDELFDGLIEKKKTRARKVVEVEVSDIHDQFEVEIKKKARKSTKKKADGDGNPGGAAS
jgi:hypothetical protein